MRLRIPDRSESGERGAIAVLSALLMVVVLAVAALGVDIATQVNQLQKLHDTIDSAAQAGAYRLPGSGTTAKADALAFAAKNDPAAPVPTVTFFCVVASKASGSTWVVDSTQIPATCNPATAGPSFTGFVCNATICSIPCTIAEACNVIRVSDAKPVPFSFAPAIGITTGGTGSVTSVACKGSCGNPPQNPMDVAVVADRTGSMSTTDIGAMITGIKSMFQVMTPSQQYVSLGTIGWSDPAAPSNCKSNDSTSSPSSFSDTSGVWMPVPFSNDYLNPGTTTVNTSSQLVQAVNCLTNQSGTGTHLAAPMKAAARYLLGNDPNNLGSLPARTGNVRKAIIFETDGTPNEKYTGGSTALNLSGGIGSAAANTDLACSNFTTVAANAKSASPGILVVTVAFNMATTDKCSTAGGSVRIDQTMAAAASPTPSGTASDANFDCATAAGRNSENADGDYFFCGGTGADMASIFKTAFGQLSTGIKLMQLP